MTTNEFDTADGNYTIKSYGNGWAYTITCNATGDDLWFQDHDAEQLQADTNNFEDTATITQHFECLHG